MKPQATVQSSGQTRAPLTEAQKDQACDVLIAILTRLLEKGEIESVDNKPHPDPDLMKCSCRFWAREFRAEDMERELQRHHKTCPMREKSGSDSDK